jgi:MoaA/NifB/PqqE/SkfB family radical SAM enzyme
MVFYPTFHPHFVGIGEFLDKAVFLKQAGYRVVARMVAYPPLFAELPGYQRRFEEAGIVVRFNAFFGEYNGRLYPEAYSPEERDWLRRQTMIAEKPYQINLAQESPRGRLCETGSRYFRVYPNGDVYRCAPVVAANAVLGNIKDPGFELKAGATPCPADRCFCLTEYMYLKDLRQEELFKAPEVAAADAREHSGL